MIGRIRGTLVYKQPPDILVDVGGVGYDIQVPMSTLFQLRALFRQLVKVSGVGPKLALTILSGMDAVAFARCVERDDLSALVALPGVGKKTAERLLVEMRDKLKHLLGQWAGADTGPVADPYMAHSDHVADAEGALIALGYKPAEAARMIAAVNDDNAMDSEALIRRALKAVVQR